MCAALIREQGGEGKGTPKGNAATAFQDAAGTKATPHQKQHKHRPEEEEESEREGEKERERERERIRRKKKTQPGSLKSSIKGRG